MVQTLTCTGDLVHLFPREIATPLDSETVEVVASRWLTGTLEVRARLLRLAAQLPQPVSDEPLSVQ